MSAATTIPATHSVLGLLSGVGTATEIGRGNGVAGPAWKRTTEALRDLGQLTDDWDGQGAEAPRPATTEGARALAAILETKHDVPPDRVMPGVTGTVILEWQREGWYVEIEVTDRQRADVMTTSPAGASTHGTLQWNALSYDADKPRW